MGRTRWLTESWRRQGVGTTFVETPFVHPLRSLAARVRRVLSSSSRVNLVRPWPPAPILQWPRMEPDRLRGSFRRRASGLRRQLERSIAWDTSVAVVVTPAWAPWLEELPFRVVIYDCIDDPAVHTPTPAHEPLYEGWQKELIDRADGAVATVGALADAIHAQRDDLPIAKIPNGVDVDWFQARRDSQPPPEDVLPTGRPVVGFVGALYHWIDWDLIAQVARMLAGFDFLLIGPVGERSGPERLRGITNIRLLGPRPYDCVPGYVQAFDVCWVPFKQTGVAMAADPVKVYEYLALGKPVVATPVGDLATFGDVVRLGRRPEEIAELLRVAVGTGEAGREERIAFARRNSWNDRATAYVGFAKSLMTTGHAAPRSDRENAVAGLGEHTENTVL
ncbi:MAG: glycosyltransferase [Planctomycetota bacterium]